MHEIESDLGADSEEWIEQWSRELDVWLQRLVEFDAYLAARGNG